VRTYGRIFAFTREMIINDDLGALDQWMRAAGRLAVEFEARLLSDLLTANAGLGPVLSDGKTLFHADHATSRRVAARSVFKPLTPPGPLCAARKASTAWW
jgi:hypothetical protein